MRPLLIAAAAALIALPAVADEPPIPMKKAPNLDKVEEVLVITKVIDKSPDHQETVKGLRAADIIAQRLPTIVTKPSASMVTISPVSYQPPAGATMSPFLR